MIGTLKKQLWLWLVAAMAIWLAETVLIFTTSSKVKTFGMLFKQVNFYDALLVIHGPRDIWTAFLIYLPVMLIIGILVNISGSLLKSERLGGPYLGSRTAYNTASYVVLFLGTVTLVMTNLLIRSHPHNNHYQLFMCLYLLMAFLVGMAAWRDVKRAEERGAAKFHALGWILNVTAGIFLFLPLVQLKYDLNWKGSTWKDLTFFLAGWLIIGGVVINKISRWNFLARLVEKRSGLIAGAGMAMSVLCLIFLSATTRSNEDVMARMSAMEGANKASKLRGFLPEPDFPEEWEIEWKKRVKNTRPVDKMPNIFLVVIDTLRADALGAYDPAKKTPYFDRVAAEGVVFERAYSASPWTVAGHASMFTGTYPSIHGANYEVLRLADGIPTLAKVLGWAGYESIALSTNCWLNYQTNVNSGFDYFINSCGYGQINKVRRVIKRDKKIPLWKNVELFATRRLPRWFDIRVPRKRYKGKQPKKGHWIQKEVESWHERKKDKPFFLFVNYINPHSPYFYDKEFAPEIPEEIDLKYLRRTVSSPMKYIAGIDKLNETEMAILRELYDASVQTADRLVEKVAQFLEEKGELENSIIIITSDHGEYIGEHGQVNHFFGVYDPVIKIPLIIRYPGALKPGVRIAEQVQTTDLFLTLMELVGIEYDHGGRVLGKNLLPIIKGKPRGGPIIAEIMENRIGLDRLKKVNPPEEVVKRYEGRFYTVLENEYQYVYSTASRTGRLYRINTDNSQGVDVTEKAPDKAMEMHDFIEKWIVAAEELRMFSENDVKTRIEDLSEETRQQLKALGYLDN